MLVFLPNTNQHLFTYNKTCGQVYSIEVTCFMLGQDLFSFHAQGSMDSSEQFKGKGDIGTCQRNIQVTGKIKEIFPSNNK
jgi:hypothetical protein